MTIQCMHVRADCKTSDERNRPQRMEFEARLKDSIVMAW